MTKTVLELQNQIHKLEQKDPQMNRNIINKLQRKLKKLQSAEEKEE